MGSRGLVVALLELAEADVIDDEECGASPGAQAFGICAVGETGMEVVEQVDAARVADRNALLTGAQPECLEDVALAGAGLTGDEQVILTLDESEAAELDDGALV